MTVCLDSAGAEAGRPYVERAAPAHPSLVDVAHRSVALFGFVNIPNSVWIDEGGTIVRPAEPAWPPAPPPAPRPAAPPPQDLPERARVMAAEAAKIVADRGPYVAALRDWAERGADSHFALAPDEVIARSGERDRGASEAAAHFELAQHLYRAGDLAAARPHFREAHRLQPGNWAYRRQAWSLEPSLYTGLRSRFWQGPLPGQEAEWPYDGDWASDAQAIGGENYYPRFRA